MSLTCPVKGRQTGAEGSPGPHPVLRLRRQGQGLARSALCHEVDLHIAMFPLAKHM